jgi:hypothetical protein
LMQHSADEDATSPKTLEFTYGGHSKDFHAHADGLV